MKRIAPILALLLALLALQGAAAAPAEPTQFRNLSGQGGFSTSEGCIETSTRVFVVDSWDHQPPGAPIESISAEIETVQVNTCTGTALHSVQGWTDQVRFSADNRLRLGEMSATFTGLTDTVTGETVDLTVNVEWIGTEELTVSRSHNVEQTAQGLLNVHGSYSERVGTMTVRVSGDVGFEGSGFGFMGLTEQQSVVVPAA